MGNFANALTSQPEWLNPKWVAAVYSPGVAKTIEELKAELKKQKAVLTFRSSPPAWPRY
jgi:malic enzyme